MMRWQATAPPGKEYGELDGEPTQNSQIARMAFVLTKVAAGAEKQVFERLALHSRRNDGESYISTNSKWMEDPVPLRKGWYFEGCTSLKQKQDILQGLTKTGVSSRFVACADDFVAGNRIDEYMPTEDEMAKVLEGLRKEEAE
jgi:hypothetical protein